MESRISVLGAIVGPAGNLRGDCFVFGRDAIMAAVVLVSEDDRLDAELRGRLAGAGFSVRRYCSAWHLEERGARRADVVFLDQSSCPGSLSDAVARCLEAVSGCMIVVLADAPATRDVVSAMKAGAWWVVDKPVSGDCLESILAEALLGGEGRQSEGGVVLVGRLGVLTQQQQRVAGLIYAGRSNREIAAELGISVKTVESHRSGIMERLGQSSVAGLIRLMSGELRGGDVGQQSRGEVDWVLEPTPAMISNRRI